MIGWSLMTSNAYFVFVWRIDNACTNRNWHAHFHLSTSDIVGFNILLNSKAFYIKAKLKPQPNKYLSIKTRDTSKNLVIVLLKIAAPTIFYCKAFHVILNDFQCFSKCDMLAILWWLLKGITRFLICMSDQADTTTRVFFEWE